jgi:hypothetical protein
MESSKVSPSKTLDNICKEYKPFEVDFVIPSPDGDVRVYLDLYLMYESKDPEWHEVQAVVFDYFNELLQGYRLKKISSEQLLDRLNFPEVQSIGFGYCEAGVKGRGTHIERAILIKEAIFDNAEVQEFGLETLAKTSIQIDGIGPDLLSDLVGNFALFSLIEYTKEQVKTYSLKTMSVNLQNGYNITTKQWQPAIKVDLPYFNNGEYRLLVPRHVSRRMPILSTDEFYKGFLKYVLQDEELSRKRIVSTFGKEPKVRIKDLEKKLEDKYESIALAARTIAIERPELVKDYAHNPHKFAGKRRPRKPKISWSTYIEELKKMPPGSEHSHDYSLLLLKIFNAMYGENLLRGKIETTSYEGIYRYDINFLNASMTALFQIIKNQQVKAGLLLIEAKNYGATDVGNKEFNQSLAYTIKDGRDFIFLIQREDVTQEDIDRSKTIYLRHRVIIMPLSDGDIIQMIENRKDNDKEFDSFIQDRLQQILSV